MTGWHGLLVLLAVGVAGAFLLVYPRAFLGVDFDVYRGAATAVLDCDPLYGFTSSLTLPFTYPPIAAVVFGPLAFLPATVAAAAWTLISVLAMEALIWTLLGPLGVTDPAARIRWTAVASLVMLPLAPVTFNLWIGQINMILLLLVIADLVGATGRFRGVGVGIAAGIKLTPLIFVPYLLFTRGRHRGADLRRHHPRRFPAAAPGCHAVLVHRAVGLQAGDGDPGRRGRTSPERLPSRRARPAAGPARRRGLAGARGTGRHGRACGGDPGKPARARLGRHPGVCHHRTAGLTGLLDIPLGVVHTVAVAVGLYVLVGAGALAVFPRRAATRRLSSLDQPGPG